MKRKNPLYLATAKFDITLPVKKMILLTSFLIAGLLLQAQEHTKAEEKEEGNKGFHQLGFMISHSSIKTVTEGKKKWVLNPSFALDYNYWLSNRFAVGLHTDVITESFQFESGDVVLERTRPFALVPAVSYKPGAHCVFVLGMGGEFAKEGDLAITRLGYEYGFELPKNFELSFAFSYDIKWNAYDTWSYGISVSKKFR